MTQPSTVDPHFVSTAGADASAETTRTNRWTTDANGDPYLDADCEKCGRQAYTRYADEVEITAPGDQVRRFAVGEFHYLCRVHWYLYLIYERLNRCSNN